MSGLLGGVVKDSHFGNAFCNSVTNPTETSYSFGGGYEVGEILMVMVGSIITPVQSKYTVNGNIADWFERKKVCALDMNLKGRVWQ